MSFTIFDNVVVVAIAARKVLHVFLVLPYYQSSYIFLCLSYFLKRWKVWLIDWDTEAQQNNVNIMGYGTTGKSWRH